MDLALTEEQEMLKAAVRRFVDTEYPKDTLLELSATGQSAPSEPWEKLAGTGWLGIIIPTEFGGEGGSFTDAGVLFEELGRGPVPGPHLSSAALGALTILEAGTTDQKRGLLPDVASGRRTIALAITEADYQWDESDVQTLATASGDGYRISGTKVYVYDAASATDLICAVRTENRQHVGMVLIPADAPGVSIRRLEGFAWNLSEVRLDGVQIAPSAILGATFAGGWEALERAVATSIPMLCAYQVGGSQQVYEMSVDYSRTRIQFGTPSDASSASRTTSSTSSTNWTPPAGPPTRRSGSSTRNATPPTASTWRRRSAARRITTPATTPTRYTPAWAAPPNTA